MTKEPTIQEMNEVIAQFDGWSYDGKDICWDTPLWFKENKRLPFCELEYHSDWNWLIGAWYKFRGLKISETDEGFNDKYSRHLQSTGTAIIHYGITEVHKRLYKAIQWYNENQTP